MTTLERLERVKPATGFRDRMFGLLRHARLAQGAGIWLAPCKAIHTVGMRFPIDVVFVSRSGTILRIDPAVPPYRFRLCWRAGSVIETSAGWACAIGLKPGEFIGYPPALSAAAVNRSK